MGATFKDNWAGRGVCTDLRTILPLCREGNLPVLVGDVGGDPMNGVKLGGFITAWTSVSQGSSRDTTQTGSGIPPLWRMI